MRNFAIFVALLVAGCGVRVPPIQEFPGDAVDGQLLVREIVANVTCEVQDALVYLVTQDKKLASLNRGRRSAEWIEKWGAQISLTLTIEEKSSFSPNTTLLPVSPPTRVFTLATGAGLASNATRTDKLGSYYTVPELLQRGGCGQDSRPSKGMLLQSDLGLREWLVSQALLSGSGEVAYPTSPSGPLKSNVLSHEIKFEVVTSGSITPAWKLVRANINSSGTFFSTSRGRAHILLVTFGPTDKVAARSGIKAPGSAAASSHFASEIGIAVSNGIRSAVQAAQ